MASTTPPSLPESHWLAAIDHALVRRVVGRRALDLALASDLPYASPPALANGNAVVAALGESVRDGLATARPDAFRVELRIDEDSTLTGACSRCAQSFGPCMHVATVALDLACSPELRKALLTGTSTADAAARAPAARFALHTELRFDGALQAWLGPVTDGMKVEIAASPFADVDPYIGHAYGDRRDTAQARILSVVVRRAGEKKLLAPREIVPGAHVGARDRRVLEHARDRGSGRKAFYAIGVEASLAIEAMRAHGGVFANGYRTLLDFRASTVRPTIALIAPGAPHANPPFDTLSAFWTTDAGGVVISFADTAFFPGPFPFVWTRTGAIYRVAGDVDLDFAAQLAQRSSLLVPPGKLRDTGARLLRAARGRGIALPAHATFGLPPTETPRIVLRLGGEPLHVSGELFAAYRSREVSLLPGGSPGAEDGRDLELEARACAHVDAVGIVRQGDGADATAEDSQIAVSGEGAIAFWQQGLLALRAATDPPIEVELSERLARVHVGAPVTGRAHVVLEGHWLDARLEFASGELPVELDAIRAALSQKKRWVSLSDGTLARISASIETLADEATGLLSGQQGRLPAHQLGRLDRWIEEHDGRMDVSVEALRRRLRALAVAAEPEMPRGLVATLRPYQRLGLAWLQFLQVLGAGGILADDMGLGKTITTLAFLLRRKEAEGPAPSLVVCPTSVATNWVREAARFTPDLRVHLHHGPSRERDAARRLAECDLVVTTYALLRRDLEALSAIPFRCAVLDEAQNIKNAWDPLESTCRHASLSIL